MFSSLVDLCWRESVLIQKCESFNFLVCFLTFFDVIFDLLLTDDLLFTIEPMFLDNDFEILQFFFNQPEVFLLNCAEVSVLYKEKPY